MDTESKPKDSLLSALDANISQYILILREITRILRTAGENNNDGNDSMTKISPSDQIAMENDVKTVEAKVLHHLDPLFTKDKDLQKILKASKFS